MAKTNHPVEPEELMAYLDGELPPDRALSAAAHVEGCPECQRLAGDLKGVSSKMTAWQVAPSGVGIPPRVAAALQEGARRRSGFPRFPVWAWGLGGACLCLGVLVIGPLQRAVRPRAQLNALQVRDRLGIATFSGDLASAPPTQRTRSEEHTSELQS